MNIEREIEKEIYQIQKDLEFANIELLKMGDIDDDNKELQSKLEEIYNNIEKLSNNLNNLITKL